MVITMEKRTCNSPPVFREGDVRDHRARKHAVSMST
jgi:hypothetical protein